VDRVDDLSVVDALQVHRRYGEVRVAGLAMSHGASCCHAQIVHPYLAALAALAGTDQHGA
jgi:hypothetical protein